MKIVKLTFCDPSWPILRQTPDRSGRWCEYRFGELESELDSWVVYGDLPAVQTALCDPNRIVLFMGEPQAVKRYPAEFLAQFAAVVTSHEGLDHPGAIHTQQALPWFVGGRFLPATKTWDPKFRKDYDELCVELPPAKTKLMSIVATKKFVTEGHGLRCRFIERLKSEFGDEVDVFGVGHDVVADKWDAIAPYKYHFAIENSVARDYWTEKLSDAYLGGAYPLYSGCPNIGDYFDQDAMTVLDLRDFDAAIATIKRTISENRFEISADALGKAKSLVLNRYQLFPAATAILDTLPAAYRPAEVTLRPIASFERPSGGILRRVSRFVVGRTKAIAGAKR